MTATKWFHEQSKKKILTHSNSSHTLVLIDGFNQREHARKLWHQIRALLTIYLIMEYNIFIYPAVWGFVWNLSTELEPPSPR